MRDEPLNGDKAIFAFFEMVALAFAFEGVSALLNNRPWPIYTAATFASIFFFVIGIKWPLIKSRFHRPGKKILVSSLGISLKTLTVLMAVTIVVGAVSAFLVLYKFFHPSPAAFSSAAPRMSVVVLPFTNTSGDLNQEYVADGITDDITVQLSKIKGSFVIGRGTAFTFKGKVIDVREVAKELGIRYVLQGTAAQTGGGFHVTAQLIDGVSGANLWADSIDAERSQFGDIRRFLVTNLAETLRLQLISVESKKAEKASNPDAIDFTLRAWAKFNQGPSRDNLLAAEQLFGKALEKQLDYEPALAGRSRMLSYLALSFPGPAKDQQLVDAERYARKAISLEPMDPAAFYALAYTRFVQFRIAEALAANERAIELNPNFVDAVGFEGLLLILNGQAAKSFEWTEKGLELSARDPLLYMRLGYKCHAYVHLAKFRESTEWCEKSVANFPSWPALSDLVAAYTVLGETKRAEAAKVQLLKLYPEFSVDWYQKTRGYLNGSANPVFLKEITENIWNNLRKAGL
jgi:TolB-like protein